jgi:hypothetical protein
MTAAVATAIVSAPAGAEADEFRASLSGLNETPAILSEGQGRLTLNFDRKAQTVTFTLTFSNLSAPVTQAHIHFGKPRTAGGVMVFFCSNGAAPPGTQACPANGGTVTGTITAANVLPVAAQHISAGDFDALEDALDSHTAYANVHTTAFPAGEIRGEIRAGRDDD